MPVVVAVNMMDLVRKNGDRIDVKKLSAVLDRTELLVRVNSFYDGSREEINRVESYQELEELLFQRL